MASELIVLGSGTGIPTVRRGAPGYALRVGQDVLAFDAGTGTLRRLAEEGIAYGAIRHWFFSHAHLDHCGDLVPLLFAKRIPALEPNGDLNVYGWDGIAGYQEQLRELYGRWVEPKDYELTVRDLQGVPVVGHGWRVTYREVQHLPGALGFRVELPGGAVFAYSGDTGFCDAAIELGRGADVFVLECSFPDGPPTETHLTAGECGRIAAATGCRTLVLSHMYPACDEADVKAQAARHWDGDIVVAEDGLRVSITS